MGGSVGQVQVPAFVPRGQENLPRGLAERFGHHGIRDADSERAGNRFRAHSDEELSGQGAMDIDASAAEQVPRRLIDGLDLGRFQHA